MLPTREAPADILDSIVMVHNKTRGAKVFPFLFLCVWSLGIRFGRFVIVLGINTTLFCLACRQGNLKKAVKNIPAINKNVGVRHVFP